MVEALEYSLLKIRCPNKASDGSTPSLGTKQLAHPMRTGWRLGRPENAVLDGAREVKLKKDSIKIFPLPVH